MSDRDVVRLAANVLGVLVLLAAVSPFVVYAVPQVVGADHGLVVLSGSMEPKMSPGDAVIVREVPAAEIEQRDVITFQRTGSDTPTTHRVLEVRQGENGPVYVTKGDANEERDQGTVPYDRVVGEVIFVIPVIGHLIQFVNTQVGFLTLVLTPMVLFVVSELWELAQSIRQSDGERPTGGDASTSDLAASPKAAAPSTAAATSATADAGDDDGTFTLTRSSLQLLLGLFGFYVPYSAYVAYSDPEAWSIGAATATIIAFLFCLVIYVASRGSGDGSAATGRAIEGIVRHGELPARLDERTTIPLESVESLVQMAADRDDWVIYDEGRETYFLPHDDALYLHRAAAETDGGTPPAGDDRDGTPRTADESGVDPERTESPDGGEDA
jgi:signal peptidase I